MKIIHLTDTHLMPSGILANGIDPEQKLRSAITDICARHSDADLLVITGDLCNHGDAEAYALLRDILAPVPFPVRLMLGNHDRRPEFIAAFPDHPQDGNGYIQSFMDTDHGRLLFLDTHAEGMSGGVYDAPRLDWLEMALAGAGALPVTVFLHHPPVNDGIRHFRNISLHDDGALLSRLAAHPAGVRHVIFGHIHMPMVGTSPEGIPYSSGQSCTHRFITDIDLPDPWWTDGNAVYRILMIDDLGFRAFGAEVGERPMTRARICAGP
ncbi:phosphodiesterase [Falsirhodobacter sp. alg1]|uniref:phosphodiesterase n=1 Tax=Falsirhodobacter sp. alg1 TaxID=1472418 RepID=UPI0005ED9F75|nr:phosphodiesterase [Falsirhodobacter sp. alg1]